MNFITKQRDFFIEEQTFRGPCIYCIHNSANNKMYIGQASDYQDRVKKHRVELEGNRHKNSHLQRSYNKYKTTFKVYPLDKCDRADLKDREVFWIKLLNTINADLGYNKTSEGQLTGCGEFSEERRRKCSENMKKQIQDGNIKNSCPVLAYSTDTGEFYKEYPQMKDAAKDLKIKRNTISEICSGIQFSSKSFTFKKKTSEDFPFKIEIPITKFSRHRKILKIDMSTGEIVERIPSAKNLVDLLGIKYLSINQIFKRKGHIIIGNYKYIYP